MSKMEESHTPQPTENEQSQEEVSIIKFKHYNNTRINIEQKNIIYIRYKF